MPRHFYCSLLTVPLFVVSGISTFLQVGNSRPTGDTFQARRVTLSAPLDRVRRLAIGPDDNVYVLDAGNNRVVVFSATWQFLRQIAEVGQGPGELIDPYDLAVGKTGHVYVIDAMKRVQVFAADGNFLASFRYEYECLAIAVNRKGEILLSEPGRGMLITVYGPEGKIRRTFGTLKTGSRPEYKVVANRTHIAVSDSDEIYVSFDHLGILQKYDANGVLLWEREMRGNRIEAMRKMFWSDTAEKSKYGIVFTTNDSRIPAFYVCFSISVDYRQGQLYLPLNDSSIYVADIRGEAVAVIRPEKEAVQFYNSIVVDRQSRVFASSVWWGIYRISQPTDAG